MFSTGRRHTGSARRVTLILARYLVLVSLLVACSTGEQPAVEPAQGQLSAPVSASEVEPREAAPTATAEPTPTGPQPIAVVTMMGESGIMKQFDRPALAGAIAQIDEINAAGGLLGRQITYRRVDTESRKSIAQRQAERLLRDPPDLIIVSCDATFAEPILRFADENGLLTISPCADDIGYATGAWGARNFTLGAPAEFQGELAARAARARYGPTAMVLRDRTSPEALRCCDGFERAFREAGGTVAYRDEFTYDTLAPLLDRLADRAGPTSSIVLCSHLPGQTDGFPQIIQDLRLAGFAAPIVAGATADATGWFASAPLLNDMTIVSWSSIFGNDPDPQVNAVIRRANLDRDTPGAGGTTVLGADTVDVWARAVNAVSSVDPAAVGAALASTRDESLLTGQVSFAGGARIDAERTYRVLRVLGGEVQVPELITID